MKELRLPLKKKWFEMTKAGIKTEDYRDITPYWIKRLISKNGLKSEGYNEKDLVPITLDFIKDFPDKVFQISKQFDCNIMTLGYPKSSDTEKILRLEHNGIEIRTGNPEWGAEPGKFYFVIKHGDILTN